MIQAKYIQYIFNIKQLFKHYSIYLLWGLVSETTILKEQLLGWREKLFLLKHYSIN